MCFVSLLFRSKTLRTKSKSSRGKVLRDVPSVTTFIGGKRFGFAWILSRKTETSTSFMVLIKWTQRRKHKSLSDAKLNSISQGPICAAWLRFNCAMRWGSSHTWACAWWFYCQNVKNAFGEQNVLQGNSLDSKCTVLRMIRDGMRKKLFRKDFPTESSAAQQFSCFIEALICSLIWPQLPNVKVYKRNYIGSADSELNDQFAGDFQSSRDE